MRLCTALILSVMMEGLPVVKATAIASEFSMSRLTWGIDTGIGFTEHVIQANFDERTYFFLGFRGGYRISKQFSAGMELSGWLLEAGDLWNPSRGAGVNQSFLYVRYYPRHESGLFLHIGGGYLSHWNNHVGENHVARGWGMSVGGGCDYSVSSKMTLTPFLSYCFGEAKNDKHRVVNIGLGIGRK